MGVFTKIRGFLSCLLHENCEYSIKKILTYVFSTVAIYVIIFTDKDYYELLGFILILLGIRGWERIRLWKGSSDNAPPEEDLPNGGMNDDSTLGNKKRILTD